MPQPVQLALIVLALPLGAWAIEILHALIFRRLPSWSDKLSTLAMFGSLGISVYLLVTQVLGPPARDRDRGPVVDAVDAHRR